MSLNFKNVVASLAVVGLLAIYPISLMAKSNAAKNVVILTSNNVINVRGEITDSSVAETIQALRKLDSQAKAFGKQEPIYLYLYSPGGSIQAGLELMEAVRGLKRPVNTITMFAASMAFQLSQGFDDRLALRNGVYMSHRAAGGFEGNFGGKTPSQLDSRYNFWLQRLKELDQHVVDRTNGKQTLQSYQEQYQNEAWWTGQQAFDQGYADAIVTVRCGKGLEENDSHTTTFMGLQVTYETSRCPLVTALLNIKFAQPDGKSKASITDTALEEIKTKFVSGFDYVNNVQ